MFVFVVVYSVKIFFELCDFGVYSSYIVGIVVCVDVYFDFGFQYIKFFCCLFKLVFEI